MIAGIIVISFASGIIGAIRQTIVTVMVATMEMGPEEAQILGGVIQLAFTPIEIIPAAFMTGGIVAFTLQVFRGTKPDFGVIFSGGKFFLPMFGAMILQRFGMFAGMLLCIVPGVIFSLGTMLFSTTMVDKNLGAIDSLKESWRMTTGHKGNLFVFGLLMLLVTILGLLAFCVGALVSAAVGSLATSWIYLRLNGEEPVVYQG